MTISFQAYIYYTNRTYELQVNPNYNFFFNWRNKNLTLRKRRLPQQDTENTIDAVYVSNEDTLKKIETKKDA